MASCAGNRDTLQGGFAMLTRTLSLSLALLAAGCVSASSPTVEYAASRRCGSTSSPAAGHAWEDAHGRAVTPIDDSDRDVFEMRSGPTQIVQRRPSKRVISANRARLMRLEWGSEGAPRFGLVGSVDDVHVVARTQGKTIEGSIGDDRLRLVVERKGMSIDVRGAVGGERVSFRVDERGLEGEIGGWLYGLERTERGFVGRRRLIAGVVRDFTLRLPSFVASWDDPEVAALLVVLLRKF